MGELYHLLRLVRPSHWIKNVFVFAALLFSGRVTDLQAVKASVWAFVAFCLASGAVYAFNDVLDRAEDARHPVKRLRPIPSGRVRPLTAILLAVAMALGAVAIALPLGRDALDVLLAYVGLMVLYGVFLRHTVILDVILLAIGFVLRAMMGGVVIHVEVSRWLILCTFSLCLFLGFAKRMCERLTLADDVADLRRVAAWYTRERLDHMMSVSAGVAIVTYILYTVSPWTVDVLGHDRMWYTIPFVVYGLFRFYALAASGKWSGPVEILYRDRGMWFALVGYLVTVAFVLARSHS